jgi:integrase
MFSPSSSQQDSLFFEVCQWQQPLETCSNRRIVHAASPSCSLVTGNTLATNFTKAREKANIDWGAGTPATFHEQRSLSERLYSEQRLNTQLLLGHKSRKQTDSYHDDRGKNWITVAI